MSDVTRAGHGQWYAAALNKRYLRLSKRRFRGISDSTRPQMRVAIFWALSTFIDVRFSLRVILNNYYLGSKQFFIAKRASRTHALTTLLLSLKQYVRFCFSSERV